MQIAKIGFTVKRAKANYKKLRKKGKSYLDQGKKSYKKTKPTLRKIKKKSKKVSSNINYYFKEQNRQMESLRPKLFD